MRFNTGLGVHVMGDTRNNNGEYIINAQQMAGKLADRFPPDKSRWYFISAFCRSLGLYVHAAWHDNRDGNNEIYYKRSTDNGVNWDDVTRLTSDAGSSAGPSVTQPVMLMFYGMITGTEIPRYIINVTYWQPCCSNK